MEEKQDNNRDPFTPVQEEVEVEVSEEDEQDSSSASSESEEWPNTAAEPNESKLLGTTSKVELCCSKEMMPSATSGHVIWNMNEPWHIQNTEYAVYN